MDERTARALDADKDKAIKIAFKVAEFGCMKITNYDDIDLNDLNTQGQYAHKVPRKNNPDNCIIGKFDIFSFIS